MEGQIILVDRLYQLYRDARTSVKEGIDRG